jgi:hypothetical protein
LLFDAWCLMFAGACLMFRHCAMEDLLCLFQVFSDFFLYPLLIVSSLLFAPSHFFVVLSQVPYLFVFVVFLEASFPRIEAFILVCSREEKCFFKAENDKNKSFNSRKGSFQENNEHE